MTHGPAQNSRSKLKWSLVNMILRYTPAFVVPLLTSVAGVYLFTRLLAPHEYGIYALAVSIVQLGQTLLFSWTILGTKRFYDGAKRDGQLSALAATMYIGLLAGAIILIVICAAAVGLFPISPGLRDLLYVAVAVTIAKQLSSFSKTFELAALSGTRYVVMECAESLVALAAGVGFCAYLHLGASGILYGAMLGAGVIVLLDAPHLLRRVRGGRFDARLQRRLIAFGAPAAISFGFEYITASSDRFLVDHFLGPNAVGIYAVSYSLAERAVGAVFVALSVAGYPLMVRANEREGREGAWKQGLANAKILVTLATPALGGFVVAAPRIASVLVGPDYAVQAAAIMPPIGLAIFFFSLRAHYYANALDLANRTKLALFASVPGSLLNVALNLVLLPRIGLMGAVWSTVAAYALELAISVVQSRRVYPLPFPARDAVKAVIATALMCAALLWVPFQSAALGLVYQVCVGICTYAALAFLLDVAQVRRTAVLFLARRWSQRPA